MRNSTPIAVIIPAFNEEKAIGEVISDIPPWVDDIIVVDNGSTDRTAEVARAHGARVVPEPRRGYGAACLAGIAALKQAEVIVFLDGDHSDHPEEMAALVDPILQGEADLVIGSRILGECEPGALAPQARYGNLLACTLMRLFWGVRFTDLGPFRAICRTALERLQMCDQNYGWTVEMQIKAARCPLKTCEVPVRYRRRIGKSKISGTISGTIGAGATILSTIFCFAFTPVRPKAPASQAERLIIFTRYPEPGTTKTRLIPAFGKEGAAKLQHEMTAHILAQAGRLELTRQVAVEVRHEGGSEAAMQERFGRSCYRPQGPGDLGERMLRALEDACTARASRVVIIGADCPGITPSLLAEAFDSLHHNDLVLGPATDGGYYLIGLRRSIPQLFDGIAWGSDQVLAETMHCAEELGICVARLKTLADVDRPEDMHAWHELSGDPASCSQVGRISVIIPTVNEAAVIEAAVAAARRGRNVEVIVVDGKSDDGTADLAARSGARTVNSTPSRAGQMNLGAEIAAGDVLLFLHADTRLPQDYDTYVRQAFAKEGVVGGAFHFRVSDPPRGTRAIEWLANWRSRHLQLPYGDQAIFVRAEIFREMGGFPVMPIMEDFAFVRSLKRRGRIVIVPASVHTSAWRWRENGVLKTTLMNQMIIVAYLLGVSPQRIVRWRA